MAAGQGEADQGWDFDSSLQPTHDLQKIQNFMLHLETGTRLEAEWEGQKKWGPHNRKEYQGPRTWRDTKARRYGDLGFITQFKAPVLNVIALSEHLLYPDPGATQGEGKRKKKRRGSKSPYPND